jgi:hypothetical protein
LREDLVTLLDAFVERFHRIGIATYRSLIAEADDELLETVTAQLAELAEQTIYRALSQARDRGEIGPAQIPDRAATALPALVRNEMFFSPDPVDKEALLDILDNVYLPLIHAVSYRSGGSPQRGATIPLS